MTDKRRIHAIFNHTFLYVESNLKPYMSEREAEIWLKNFTELYEVDTDHAAHAWAELLPMPKSKPGEG